MGSNLDAACTPYRVGCGHRRSGKEFSTTRVPQQVVPELWTGGYVPPADFAKPGEYFTLGRKLHDLRLAPMNTSWCWRPCFRSLLAPRGQGAEARLKP
jgi:hypothetical protein